LFEPAVLYPAVKQPDHKLFQKLKPDITFLVSLLIINGTITVPPFMAVFVSSDKETYIA
jgi:hypothetical protein